MFKPEVLETDFWWLNPTQKREYLYVELRHHRPIHDDENLHWDALTCKTNDLDGWRTKYRNTNVYRSLQVSRLPSKEGQFAGPLVVDIDNEHDLEDTLAVTRKVVYLLQDGFGIVRDKLKTFFTGRKGFNIEVHPEAIDLRGSIDEQLIKSADFLHQVTKVLRDGRSWQTINQVSDAETVIDQIYGSRRSGYEWKHPYLRLHGSLNSWITSDGTVKSRVKIECKVDDLNILTAREIVDVSESLARQQ